MRLLVSVYTDDRTVQDGTIHWSASKPDRFSQAEGSMPKATYPRRDYPLYLVSEFSVSFSANFIHGGIVGRWNCSIRIFGILTHKLEWDPQRVRWDPS